MKIAILLLTLHSFALAQAPVPVASSKRAPADTALTADPKSAFWRNAPAVFASADTFGKSAPGHRTEIRSRWTPGNLYFLFLCPYKALNLKPHPRVDTETNELWNWDVAEVFIGADFQNIQRYKEFEISPQSEWVDLDIDLSKAHHENGWTWDSGMQASSRIDAAHKIWYGAMRIPYSSVDMRPAAPGRRFRINFYRAQGPASSHRAIAWQPTGKPTYHAPEAFGILHLID